MWYLSMVCAASLLCRSGGGVDHWTSERLAREADLVIIATVQGTKDSGEATNDNVWKAKFIGVNTTLTVKAALKGKIDTNKPLILFHYRLPRGLQIINGPDFVEFLPGNNIVQVDGNQVKQSEFLFFLRKQKDGRYCPVSGQRYAAFSVRRLIPK